MTQVDTLSSGVNLDLLEPETYTKQKSGRCVAMPEVEIGRITDFFSKPVVAGINLTGTLKVGDKVHIKGHTTDLELILESIQIDNANVTEAKDGDSIGIKVPDRVRPGDHVYKVIP
jgi:translation initiation factor IF-2